MENCKMANRKEINILLNTIGDLLWAYNKDLIMGSCYDGLKIACSKESEYLNFPLEMVPEIRKKVKEFIKDKDKNKKSKFL